MQDGRGRKQRKAKPHKRHGRGKAQNRQNQMPTGQTRGLNGKQLPVRPETAQPDQGAHEHGEGQGARQERDQLVKGDPTHSGKTQTPIDDQIREAEQILCQHQRGQPE